MCLTVRELMELCRKDFLLGRKPKLGVIIWRMLQMRALRKASVMLFGQLLPNLSS
jgi:hypothetical protein